MTYTKQVWADNDVTKPLSAARMGYIETGIETASNLPVVAADAAFSSRYYPFNGLSYTTAAARNAAITSPVAGMRVFLTTPKVWTEYDGTAWRGEWVTNFVPQIDQGATTNIAKTVGVCRYRYDGPMIDYTAYLVLTGAGTAGAGVAVSVPVAVLDDGNARAIGAGYVYDSSLATMAPGTWGHHIVAAGVLSMWTPNAAGNVWGGAPSIALAANDQIAFTVRYAWV